MRSTKYTDVNGNEILQPMQTEQGVQKGLITILTERGRDVAGKSKDDLEAMLKQEPDFQNQQIWLRELATNAGMEVEFFPKFHCEFNWIERYWCHTKRNVRKNCDYSFKTLVAAVPKYLDEVDVLTMRRASLSGTSMHTGQENEKVVQRGPQLLSNAIKSSMTLTIESTSCSNQNIERDAETLSSEQRAQHNEVMYDDEDDDASIEYNRGNDDENE